MTEPFFFSALFYQLCRSKSTSNEFTVVLEDCRSCAKYWDQPQRTYLHPILIEYVTDASNELTKNFGHVNLTMGVPIESYHSIYINYASRFDSYAPTRGSIYKPINEARTNEILKRTTHPPVQILSDGRDLPIRNFTLFRATNYVSEIVGENDIYFLKKRKLGYSSVSEPLLDIAWSRTNTSSQYVSLLLITPLNKVNPVKMVNNKCTSSERRTGTHLIDRNEQRRKYGSYVHQWHFIPGCKTPLLTPGCMNGTITV